MRTIIGSAPGRTHHNQGHLIATSATTASHATTAGSLEEACELADDATTAEVAEQRATTVTPAWHGWRLDKACVALAPEFSRSHLQTLIEAGAVRLDGVCVTTASRKLRWGQQLQLELRPTEASQAYLPQAMALDVMHEDEHLLVLNKPAGLVVHPGAGNWSGTLLNGLLAHHAEAARLPRAGIVHRLDKDTSGLMVVAKSAAAVAALVRAIGQREVQRHYLALAQGEPKEDRFSVEAPIGRDPISRVRMAVVRGGREARTDVRVQARAQGFSALACRLHTGRTHQIRVHLAHLGHPLVADSVYGGKGALGLSRQALHATQLQLAHPISGESLSFEAPAPKDFTEAWRLVARSEVRWRRWI